MELAKLAWVDWYNQRRLHSACDNRPPAECEALFYSPPSREMRALLDRGSAAREDLRDERLKLLAAQRRTVDRASCSQGHRRDLAQPPAPCPYGAPVAKRSLRLPALEYVDHVSHNEPPAKSLPPRTWASSWPTHIRLWHPMAPPPCSGWGSFPGDRHREELRGAAARHPIATAAEVGRRSRRMTAPKHS